jgi:hypothetical protein
MMVDTFKVYKKLSLEKRNNKKSHRQQCQTLLLSLISANKGVLPALVPLWVNPAGVLCTWPQGFRGLGRYSLSAPAQKPETPQAAAGISPAVRVQKDARQLGVMVDSSLSTFHKLELSVSKTQHNKHNYYSLNAKAWHPACIDAPCLTEWGCRV